MNRATRLGCFFAFVSVASAAAGCGTATTLDEDAGIVIPGDTGTVRPDTGSTTLADTGTITPADTGTVVRSDSGTITPIDGGPFTIPDSGPGNDSGTTMGVMCGTAVCSGTDICCVTRDPAGMMLSMACSAPAACTGIPVSCDGPEDCMTGDVCCASGGAGGMGSAMCTPDAMCGGFSSVRLCHTAADCTGGDGCCMFMGISACIPTRFCP